MADDRIGRKEALLAAARERLTEEQQHQQRASAAPAANSGPEIRYRGQVVRQSTAGTPGSGIRSRPTGRSGAGNDDVRAALQKIKDLYRDGLISRAEAEKKRSDILDRL